MKQNDALRACINENLSGLTVSQGLRSELMNEINGGKKVKRKLKASFVLAVVLVLLAAVALAWGLSYSPKVSAELAARNAVMQKYGFTRETMDMFGASVGDDGATVRLWLLGEIEDAEKRAGEYTVVLSADGTATATWSHDDADPSAYADGALDSEAWGAKQILAYRAQRDEANRAYTAEWRALYGEDGQGGSAVQAMPESTEEPRGRLTAAQSIEIARNAMKETYGFTDDTLTLFESDTAIGELGVGEHEDDTWGVVFTPTPATGILWTSEENPLGRYVVAVRDETGEVLETRWNVNVEDTAAYTSGTWGQAKSYRAELLPWVLELVRQGDAYQRKWEAQAAITPGSPSVEDEAAYDKLFRDAGFDPSQYNHVLPQTGDLSREQALDVAARALEEQFGVSRKTFDASAFAYDDLTQEDDHREWYFWLQNEEAQCGWSVVLHAETGEILHIMADPFATSNG